MARDRWGCAGSTQQCSPDTAAEELLGCRPANGLGGAAKGCAVSSSNRLRTRAAGIYPFAGKEVARAFALFSTELSDCNDNLEGLSYTELESLRDWTAKFDAKYPIIGKLVK